MPIQEWSKFWKITESVIHPSTKRNNWKINRTCGALSNFHWRGLFGHNCFFDGGRGRVGAAWGVMYLKHEYTFRAAPISSWLLLGRVGFSGRAAGIRHCPIRLNWSSHMVVMRIAHGDAWGTMRCAYSAQSGVHGAVHEPSVAAHGVLTASSGAYSAVRRTPLSFFYSIILTFKITESMIYPAIKRSNWELCRTNAYFDAFMWSARAPHRTWWRAKRHVWCMWCRAVVCSTYCGAWYTNCSGWYTCRHTWCTSRLIWLSKDK